MTVYVITLEEIEESITKAIYAVKEEAEDQASLLCLDGGVYKVEAWKVIETLKENVHPWKM